MYVHTYKKCIQPECVLPKFYGLPKIHIKDIPHRPIVSSRESVTYGVAKELTSISQALAGRSMHHVQNIQNFIASIKHISYSQGNV